MILYTCSRTQIHQYEPYQNNQINKFHQNHSFWFNLYRWTIISLKRPLLTSWGLLPSWAASWPHPHGLPGRHSTGQYDLAGPGSPQEHLHRMQKHHVTHWFETWTKYHIDQLKKNSNAFYDWNHLHFQCLKLMVAHSPLATKNWSESVKLDPGQV